MKVALVHDDLMQWGGAERVLVALSEMFPDAPIYTSVFNKQNPVLKEKFRNTKVVTSFMQRIPFWKRLYKVLLPFYPIAFEQFDFSDYDLVISQTTRFAKSIITKPGTVHVCLCHTPPRFLWGYSGETLPNLFGYANWLRRYDKVSSQRVDHFLAGSKNAKERIKEVYGVDSTVLYPFVDLQRFSHLEPFDGGYLLVIARLNKYKKVDLVIQASNKLKVPLKIVGVGPEMGNLQKQAGSQVEFLGQLDEQTLDLVISGCRCLIVAAEEDFGLTPLEAQALGKPVIAFKKGGALETVLEGQTGYFYDTHSPESLISALNLLERNGYNEKASRKQAERFSRVNFMDQLNAFLKTL